MQQALVMAPQREASSTRASLFFEWLHAPSSQLFKAV
jgi:hypothetical protein